MPDSPQVPGYIAASLAKFPARPEVHDAHDILMALYAATGITADGLYRTVPPELLTAARGMLRCVAKHGRAEEHVGQFLNVPGGRHPEDLLTVIQVWIACAAPQWTNGRDHQDAIFSFAAYDENGDQVGIDSLAPHELLAARMITAVLGHDRDQFCALAYTALEESPYHLINGAIGVLELCAQTVQDGA